MPQRFAMFCAMEQRFSKGVNVLSATSTPVYKHASRRFIRDMKRNLWCTHIVRNFQRSMLMTLSSHLQELRKKHQNLSEQVEQAQRSPATDDLKNPKFKKAKT